MQSQFFTYDKGKVMQALRYHFITRKEIKFMIIFINLFAIISALLFSFKKVTPLAFLTGSILWFIIMIAFWFVMPIVIYRQSATFKDKLRATVGLNNFTIENDKGSKSWQWNEFSEMMESPHFFHLYFNKRSFFIVPKNAFTTEQQIEASKIFKEKIKQA